MDNKEVKGFLAGLGIGSVLAGLGVFLVDPKNRKKVQQTMEDLKGGVEDMRQKLDKAIEEAKKKGKKKMVKELENAKKTLEKADEEMKKSKE